MCSHVAAVETWIRFGVASLTCTSIWCVLLQETLIFNSILEYYTYKHVTYFMQCLPSLVCFMVTASCFTASWGYQSLPTTFQCTQSLFMTRWRRGNKWVTGHAAYVTYRLHPQLFQKKLGFQSESKGNYGRFCQSSENNTEQSIACKVTCTCTRTYLDSIDSGCHNQTVHSTKPLPPTVCSVKLWSQNENEAADIGMCYRPAIELQPWGKATCTLASDNGQVTPHTEGYEHWYILLRFSKKKLGFSVCWYWNVLSPCDWAAIIGSGYMHSGFRPLTRASKKEAKIEYSNCCRRW